MLDRVRITLALLITAIVSTTAAAVPGSTTFTDERFSVTLPPGWRQIPEQDLADLTEWIAAATAGLSVESYEFGFVPDDFDADPWLPHMLVQIREAARIPYGRFLTLDGTGPGVLADSDDLSRTLPRLYVGVGLDRARFDPETFTLRVEHTLDLRFKGRVRVQTAAFLTETGLVALHYVDRDHRSDEARLLFDVIVSGVSIAPELQYRPRVLDRWPGLPFFIAAGVVALGLALYLALRRQPT